MNKIKYSSLFIICYFMIPASVFSQLDKKSESEFNKKFDAAETYLEAENYIKALPVLLQLDSMDPGNANIKYKIGQCYLHSTLEKNIAIQYFQKSVKAVTLNYLEGVASERKAPVFVFFDLGTAYRFNYQFDTAIAYYHKFKTLLSDKEKKLMVDANRHIRMCQTAKSMIDNPVTTVITNLGAAVNSPFPDYSPVITADESMLIFTSRRPGDNAKPGMDESGLPYEDIYVSNKINGVWRPAIPIDSTINTKGHEATIGLSIDGTYLLIYKDDNGDGNVYQSFNNGEQWTVPEKLSGEINSASWETHAVYSADGNALFFVSDRPGGFGGRDIYRVKRLPNGNWSLPLNLGPCVNTAYDEDAPFMHPDGRTLYFSSCGHNTMGGFDIFYTDINVEEDKCAPPVNVGYPVNTPDDDIFYVVSPDGKRGYYSSIRQDGNGDKDLYLVTMPEAEEKNLALIKGIFTDVAGKVPEDATITVIDNETGEIIGVYRPNPVTGKYLFILPQGKKYNVTYEAQGMLFKSDNMVIPEGTAYGEIESAVELQPIQTGSSTVLNNLFFESGKIILRNESLDELQRVLRLLKNNPGVMIEISGHTDSKGSDEFNMQLSQQRASSVVKYLTENGITSKRMVAKGYGETKPVAPNSNPDGTENAEGMAKNRRIELKILEVSGKK